MSSRYNLFLLEDLKILSNGKCNTPVVAGCLATSWRQGGMSASNSWPSFCSTAALLHWAVSYAADRKFIHPTTPPPLNFFLKLFFFSEWCTPLHYRGYPRRGNYSCSANKSLFTCSLRFSDQWGIFYSLESHVGLHIYTLSFCLSLRTFGFPFFSLLNEAFWRKGEKSSNPTLQWRNNTDI